VRQRAQDLRVFEPSQPLAAQRGLQFGDPFGRPIGQIGQRAVFDAAAATGGFRAAGWAGRAFWLETVTTYLGGLESFALVVNGAQHAHGGGAHAARRSATSTPMLVVVQGGPRPMRMVGERARSIALVGTEQMNRGNLEPFEQPSQCLAKLKIVGVSIWL
jgi:hypothetical protein